MQWKWLVIPSVIFSLSYCNYSLAGEWRLLIGGSCVSGQELGGSNSQLTPKNYLSSLKRDAENNGQLASGHIDEIRSKTGKVARVYFSTAGSKVKDIILINNSLTCAKFVTYCTTNKYSSFGKCFSAIYANPKGGNENSGGDPTTTAGMNQEIGGDIKAVDDKLNVVYNELLKKMPPAFQQQLIQSEKDWIKYRDSTVAITAWQEAGGTAQELNQDGEYLTLEKSRLKFLESLLTP